MSIEASGEYLRVLRQARRLSRNALGLKLNTDHSLIERVEKGQTDTRGSLLLRMLQALEGSPEQLVALLTNPDATPEDGRRMANEWIANGDALSSASHEVEDLAKRLARDPTRLQKWLGYGERLLEELD